MSLLLATLAGLIGVWRLAMKQSFGFSLLGIAVVLVIAGRIHPF